MLTRIALQNFKCFRELHIEPGLITVLIGPNGTGKSGVLQALLLLKQSQNAATNLRLNGPLVQMSSEEFMFRGVERATDHVGIGLAGVRDIQFQSVASEVSFNIELQYWEDGRASGPKTGATEFDLEGRKHRVEVPESEFTERIDGLSGTVAIGRGFGIDVLDVSQFRSIDALTVRYLVELAGVPQKILEIMKVVSPHRGFARRQYPLGTEKFEQFSSAEGLGQPELQTASTLGYSQSHVVTISDWLKRVTGIGFKTNIVPPQAVEPVSESPAGEFNLLMEGSGTNSLINLLFELARSEKGATVLIEEPEIHLHPKAQAELASVLVEEALAGNKQVIMTTHSEHVAARLLTLVAEGKLASEDLAIYSFEKDESGVGSASRIDVTDRGQVVGGLKGFFDANLDEMDRYVRALQTSS